ncbi:MAG: hypothetical protein K6U03_06275, partial [Firmicutes bacterium]|nr:hypothetical protein [Bacillota bacterium]
ARLVPAAVEELIGQLVGLSGAALALCKRAMRFASQPFAEALAAVERLYLEDLMATADAHEGLAAFLSVRHLFATNRLLPPDPAAYWPRADLTLQTVKIGLPAGFQQTIVSFGALVLSALVNSFGPTVAAAFGAASRLDQFSFLPTMSISLATSALVGQNLGAGAEERAHETLRLSAMLASAITACVTMVVILLPRPLLSIFTKDAAVLAEGTRYLRIVSLGYVPFSVMFALNGLLRGAGDTFPTMITSLVSLWLVRLPLAGWLSHGAGLGSRGIWIGMAVSPLTGLAMSYAYYRSGRWRRKVVAKRCAQE